MAAPRTRRALQQRAPGPSRTLCQALLGALFCLVHAVAVGGLNETVDDAAVAFFREQGLQHGQVMDHLSWLSDVYGPRLTGSPGLRRAQGWAKATFDSWGLDNVHFEEWGPFGRGWGLHSFRARVLTSAPWIAHVYPRAWSPPLQPVAADVVAVGSLSEEELRDVDIAGKIVLIHPTRNVKEPFGPSAQRFSNQTLDQLAAAPDDPRLHKWQSKPPWLAAGVHPKTLAHVLSKKPLAILDRGVIGQYGVLTPTTTLTSPVRPRGEERRAPPHELVPQFTTAIEHYNRIARLLARGERVRMELALNATYYEDDPMERNVIAEIKGPAAAGAGEVVMLGAHQDSWHSGTGATDNGAGCAVVMEAMRLIHQLVAHTGVAPRRTVRVALWSGEEQGLLGSAAYVKQHFATPLDPAGAPARPGQVPLQLLSDHRLLSAYYNVDAGTGRIRGIFLNGNSAAAAPITAAFEPLRDLGVGTVAQRFQGASDHVPFLRAGLPAFFFVQDPVAYAFKTRHSNMDSFDHVLAEDLQQAAVVVASVVWHTTQRAERMPRG